MPFIQLVWAAGKRERIVRALWDSLGTRQRRALLYLLGAKNVVWSQALWWWQRSSRRASHEVRREVLRLCSS